MILLRLHGFGLADAIEARKQIQEKLGGNLSGEVTRTLSIEIIPSDVQHFRGYTQPYVEMCTNKEPYMSLLLPLLRKVTVFTTESVKPVNFICTLIHGVTEL